MTAEEFAKGILYLSAGINQRLSDAALEPYFDMLGHLDYNTFLLACRRVLASHVWNTFPSVAELLKAANESSSKSQLTAAEAFTLAQRAAAQIDPRIVGPYRVRVNGEWQEFDSQADYIFARLNISEPVQRAIRVFGIEALCNTDEPIAVMRAHFGKMFDQLEDRERREALLPPSVREYLTEKRDGDLIHKAMAGIGELPK